MTGSEVLLVLGGVLVGFGLCDAFYYFTIRRDERLGDTRPVADGWDNLTHVRVVDK